MSTFDGFLNKAKNLASAAGKKTGEMVEVGKLRLQAVQITADIDKAYERMGSLQYEQMKKGVDNSLAMDGCMAEIDALRASLDDVNRQIDDSKSASRCPRCGSSNAEGAAFCSHCGGSLGGDQVYGKEVVVEAEEVTDAPEAEAAAPSDVIKDD